jgi:hypothetical protein
MLSWMAIITISGICPLDEGQQNKIRRLPHYRSLVSSSPSSLPSSEEWIGFYEAVINILIVSNFFKPERYE